MIISYKHHFIFIHIHKTGGDSISTALSPFLDSSDFVLKNDWQAWLQKLRSGSRHSELATLRKHSPASAVVRVVPEHVWDGSFKFAFVRHPITRAVSLYKYAARKADERTRLIPRNVWHLIPPGRRTDPLRWPSVRAFADAPAFCDFIRHPLLERELSMSSQWSSLSDESGRQLVDFVGRFERLEDDFNLVRDRLGLPEVSLGRHNVSHRPKELEISRDDRRYLAKRFEDDFERFGYDPFE